MKVNDECCCTGIRYCERCIDSERAQSIVNKKFSLTKASDVISQQYGEERTSSCSFAFLGLSKYSLCWNCNLIFNMRDKAFKTCIDHKDLIPNNNIKLDGLWVVPNFVSESEENKIISFFDNPTSPFPGWKLSQSGRRKQDFGPKANFKKRKVKLSDILGMPLQLKEILQKINNFVTEKSNKEFCIVEASALEYTEDCGSNIDPHIDDTWLWGNRIGGVNLLEDTVITFVHIDESLVDVFIPRGSFFLISNNSRYEWMHGIRLENIKKRRISITVRELSENLEVEPELLKEILKISSTFI